MSQTCIKIIRALVCDPSLGTPDVYVRVRALSGAGTQIGATQSTLVVESTSPTWNKLVCFSGPVDHFDVEMWDDDLYPNPDDFMAGGVIKGTISAETRVP